MNDYYHELGLESLSDSIIVIDDGTEDLFTFLILFPVIHLFIYIHCCLLSSDLMIL